MIKKLLYSMLSGLVLPFAALAQDFKITHGPYLQAVGENEAAIVWTTNRDAVSWVELAPAGDDSFYSQARPAYYQAKDGNRAVGKLHKVKISGLAKGTEYRYRCFAKEVTLYEGQSSVLYGKSIATDVYGKKPLRFKTLDKAKENISFTVVNDIHSRVPDLQVLCKDVAYGKTDFVIFNGDMVSAMNDEASFFAGFMDNAVGMFASEVPVFYARGNHETRGKFNAQLSSYFPTSTGKLYYTFRQGSAFFVVLDSGEDKPDTDIAYSGLAQFDAYRTEQQEWLKGVLQSKDFLSAKYRIVIVHIPPVASDDWHGTNEVRDKFLPVLKNAGITLMLCGHTHQYGYAEPDMQQHDFPVLINASNTALDVSITPDGMVVKNKDLENKELRSFTFH
ncbi:MAG: metallophosphoesterase [Prevotellaceae bacterium]|nr:metallophosphoesterase [Prevotellaceae bacterium]